MKLAWLIDLVTQWHMIWMVESILIFNGFFRFEFFLILFLNLKLPLNYTEINFQQF